PGSMGLLAQAGKTNGTRQATRARLRFMRDVLRRPHDRRRAAAATPAACAALLYAMAVFARGGDQARRARASRISRSSSTSSGVGGAAAGGAGAFLAFISFCTTMKITNATMMKLMIAARTEPTWIFHTIQVSQLPWGRNAVTTGMMTP